MSRVNTGFNREGKVSLEVRHLASLSSISEEEWDALALAANNFYMSYHWLKLVESDTAAEPLYILIYNVKQLVGALPTYVVSQEFNLEYEPERLVDGRWRGSFLLAGSRRAYLNDLLLSAKVDHETRLEIVRTLYTAIADRCQEAQRDATLFLYLSTRSGRLLNQVETHTIPILMAAEVTLDLPGKDLEDYLVTLSPSRQPRIRHEIRTFERSGYEVRTEKLGDCWEEVGCLLGQLQKKYGIVRPDEYWQSMLRQQAEYLNEQSLVFTCCSGGQLVGFSLAYKWGGTLWLRAVGFDYGRLRRGYEYFNLVFYQPLYYAYARGLKRLHLGRESYEAKVNRGGRLSPLWGVELKPGIMDDHLTSSWEYNRRVSAAWRQRFVHARYEVLADEGWREWGCGH